MDLLIKLNNSQLELESLEAKRVLSIMELNKAHRILVVWRDAFKGGLSCSIYLRAESVKMKNTNAPGGIGNGWEHTHAILERSDGVKHKITLKQYDIIKRIKKKELKL